MRNAKLLLERLTELYPPNPPARHAITLDRGHLTITMIVSGYFYPIVLTEDTDLDEPIEKTVSEIQELMDPVLKHGPEAWPSGLIQDDYPPIEAVEVDTQWRREPIAQELHAQWRRVVELGRDVILLVISNPPTVEEMLRWSPVDLDQAVTWAVTEHHAAADNDVTRLPRPAVLGGFMGIPVILDSSLRDDEWYFKPGQQPPRPTEEGIRRHPPDGYVDDCLLGRVPCTCQPNCQDPCKGKYSGCTCVACDVLYQDYLSNDWE
ncbi:MAG: hypothetical protein KC441_00920 [Anaerolineales bacterium]|nr:hypothetical protein [Anaerolineales bacterium]